MLQEPEDQFKFTDKGLATTTANWTEPTAADNYGIPILTSNYNSEDSFSIGISQVVYTSTDVAGNVAVCIFHIFITGTVCLIIIKGIRTWL